MRHNILSKRSQTQKNTHCIISFMQTSRKCKLIITDKSKCLFGDRGVNWQGRCFFIIYFLNFWLHWVSIAAQGLLCSCSARPSHCSGFSCCRAHGQGLRASVVAACGLWSTGSVAVAYRLCCSTACEIFLDQGSNPCPLHWQVGSYPLCHQGSLAGKFWGRIHKDPKENLGVEVIDVFPILIVVMLHRCIQWTLEQYQVWTCMGLFAFSTVNSIVLHWCMIG